MVGRKSSVVHTIGHSNHSAARFTALLQQHRISLVIDVRSSPQSRYAPHFNKQEIVSVLNQSGLEYTFAGRSLGGRPADPDLYDNGHVSYAKMSETSGFNSALKKMAALAREQSIAIMCAESDPLDCHRFLLIGRELVRRGTDVTHILSNGSSETHAGAEKRLLQALRLNQPGFFDEPLDVIAEAYRIQESRVAFRQHRPAQDIARIGQA